MKKKNLPIILVVGAALLIVMGLCALTAVGSLTYLRKSNFDWGVLRPQDISAKVTEAKTIEVEEGTELELTSSAGNVTIIGSETGGEIEVQMVKTAWRATDEEAREAAEALQASFTETSGKLIIDYSISSRTSYLSSSGGIDKIDFTIHVPTGTELNIKTSFGAIKVSNVSGEINLETDFGKVSVEDVRGGVVVKNTNGDVIIHRVNAPDGNVEVKSSFGSIDIEDVEAKTIDLSNTNGDLTGEILKASGEIRLDTEFGTIKFSQLEGASLNADSSNGKVDLRNGAFSGDLTIRTGFQAATVVDVEAANYTITVQNGDITLGGAQGVLDLRSDFGSIKVTEAVDARLDLHAGNGSIRFSGTLDPDSTHIAETSFGDINLSIPADVNLDILLQTEFGKVQTELPVTVKGDLSETKMTGTINAGGPLLTLKTQNGNIIISALADNE